MCCPVPPLLGGVGFPRAQDLINCLRLLIELGARVDCCDLRGNTPAHAAARRGNTECLQLLIDTNGSSTRPPTALLAPGSCFSAPVTACLVICLAMLRVSHSIPPSL